MDFEHPDFPWRFANTRAYAPVAGASAVSVDSALERLGQYDHKFGGGAGTMGGVGARVAVLRGAADLIEVRRCRLTLSNPR